MKKSKILNEIGAVLQEYKHHIEDSISRYKLAAERDDDDTTDPDDLSHQAEAADLLLRFEQLLSEAHKQELSLSKHTKDKPNCIAPGALAVTKSHYVYIGISVPPFKFNGKTVITMSEKAPAYHNMQGRKRGEMLELGEYNNRIIAVV
jgi:hypothetical protein